MKRCRFINDFNFLKLTIDLWNKNYYDVTDNISLESTTYEYEYYVTNSNIKINQHHKLFLIIVDGRVYDEADLNDYIVFNDDSDIRIISEKSFEKYFEILNEDKEILNV